MSEDAVRRMQEAAERQRQMQLQQQELALQQRMAQAAAASKAAQEAAARQAIQQQEIAKAQKLLQAAAVSKTGQEVAAKYMVTGAEMTATGLKKIIDPAITSRIIDVRIGQAEAGIQKISETQTQVKTNIPLVQNYIETLKDNISSFEAKPFNWVIVDPDTGKERRMVGADIDRMKQQKAEYEKWLENAEKFLEEAEPSKKELRESIEKLKLSKTQKGYTVSYASRVSGRKETRTFPTKEAAEAYIAKIALAEYEAAAHREREQKYVGLTLKEKAEVIRQERKAPELGVVAGWDTVKSDDFRRVESLIEKGQISPEQVLAWSKGDQVQVRVVTPPVQKGMTLQQAVAKFDKIIGDEMILLQSSGMEKLASIDAKAVGQLEYARAGMRPLTTKELEDAKIRAEAFRDFYLAGIVGGAAASIDPRAYARAAKGLSDLLRDPVTTTVATAATLKAAYDANPVGTSGMILGSITAGVVMRQALRPPASAAYNVAVKPVLNTADRAVRTLWKSMLLDPEPDLAQALKAPIFDELRQMAKMRPADPNTLKVMPDAMAPLSLFDKGPQISFWDQFREWKKFDFSYVPADPSKATTAVYNEFVEFLKIQKKYVDLKIQETRTTGPFSEFLQVSKLQKLPVTHIGKVKDGVGIIYADGTVVVKVSPDSFKSMGQPLLYRLMKRADVSTKDVDALTEIITDEFYTYIERQGVKTNLPMFEQRDIPDYMVSSAYDQYKAWHQKFGVKDSPMLTKGELEAAMRAFREAIRLEKEGPMAPIAQAMTINEHLIKQGVPASKANSVASDYAFALVTLRDMGSASPAEAQAHLMDLSVALNRINESGVPMRFDLMADITQRLANDIAEGNIQAYKNLMKMADKIASDLEETGKIDAVAYSELMEELTRISQVETPDQDVIQIITPDIVPDVDLPPPPEEPPPPDETPRLRILDKRARKRLPTIIPAGRKRVFRVVFTYPRGVKDAVKVEANTYSEAMSQAQRQRQIRKEQPVEVNLWVAG